MARRNQKSNAPQQATGNMARRDLRFAEVELVIYRIASILFLLIMLAKLIKTEWASL
ncbi:MAG TPA: hypothetical protein VF528_10760 [Pyrinomonadaceae bacterium]